MSIQALFIDDEEWHHWTLAREAAHVEEKIGICYVRTVAQAMEKMAAEEFDIVFLDSTLAPNQTLDAPTNGVFLAKCISEMADPPKLVILTSENRTANGRIRYMMKRASIPCEMIRFSLKQTLAKM